MSLNQRTCQPWIDELLDQIPTCWQSARHGATWCRVLNGSRDEEVCAWKPDNGAMTFGAQTQYAHSLLLSNEGEMELTSEYS